MRAQQSRLQLDPGPLGKASSIRRSPYAKGVALRRIIFGLRQENRILCSHAHVAGPCIAFRHDHKVCFPANFRDFVTIRHANLRARTESRPVEYWSVQNLHRRKRSLLIHTSHYFGPNSLDNASQLLTASGAEAIKHVERYLCIEHRLPEWLKRKQLTRLSFQLFDSCPPCLGYRMEVNHAHPNQP